MPFYYAVRSGHVPGVYKDWPSCEKQVKQFQKAKYRKFATEAAAWAFVHGEEVKDVYDVYSDDEAVSSAADYSKAAQSSFVNSSQEQHTTAPSAAKSQPPVADLSETLEAINMLRATARSLRSTAEQLLKERCRHIQLPNRDTGSFFALRGARI
ncbi:hypothetical protein ACOMHN_026022 [Nucella lapillus]